MPRGAVLLKLGAPAALELTLAHFKYGRFGLSWLPGRAVYRVDARPVILSSGINIKVTACSLQRCIKRMDCRGWGLAALLAGLARAELERRSWRHELAHQRAPRTTMDLSRVHQCTLLQLYVLVATASQFTRVMPFPLHLTSK